MTEDTTQLVQVALLDAARKALNFIENTEGELGEPLQCGNALRAALALEASQARDDGVREADDGPCSCGLHCCCCGPGEPCCDCGATLIDINRKKAECCWRDFLDANPDDLTSPDDLPDHALVTFEQFYEMARECLPRIAALISPTPAIIDEKKP